MLDIETLGTTPGAVILSIAAVRFDINTGAVGDTFFLKVAMGSCMEVGMHIEPETLQWWMEKSTEARDALFGQSCTLRDALVSFNAFCCQGDKVWGNGASFDLALMRTAYTKAKVPIPWHCRHERCVRTLVAFRPDFYKEHQYKGVAHNPVDDCLNQIAYCTRIWKFFNPLNNQ